MNRAEATTLVRVVKAICPSQLVDDETPTAWEMALFDISAADAMEAVKRIARRPSEPGKEYRYIEPGHIRWEVDKLRQERLDKHPQVEPPSNLSASDFLAWHRRTQERIADGEMIEQTALPARKVDYSGIVKGIENARVQLRAVPEGARVPGPSDDDERADPSGEVHGVAPHRRDEPTTARTGHGMDV